MKTAVVILNWNTRDFLGKFLPPLLDSMPEGAEVIVADSASDDGSRELLASRFPQVRTILLDQNYGFTGGYNRAFEAVCAMEGGEEMEYFVLINSDIEVSKGWIEPLVSWMDTHKDCAACAPKLHSYFEKDSFEYAGAAGGHLDRFGYPFCRGRVMKKVEKDCGQYDSPSDVFWATGACLMVRRSAYSGIGGLDARFFAHMEEIDLCWRLQLEGWRICVVPESLVWHVGGGTLPNDSPWKLKLNFRNNLLMLQNNLPSTEALLMTKEKDVGKMSGEEIGKICREACRKAGRKIFVRMLIDGLAATAYLLKLDWASFRAVLNAHREFRKLGIAPDPGKVAARLKAHPHALIGGLYRGSILWQALRHGKKAISRTDNTDQYFWN